VRKLIGGAVVALAGAATLAVAGPVGGHAWGQVNECVIVNGRGFEPKTNGTGTITCITGGTDAVSVAIAKNGRSASAAANGNQVGVAVDCVATTITNRVVHC